MMSRIAATFVSPLIFAALLLAGDAGRAAAVPTPGRALLDSVSVSTAESRHPTRWVAQTADPDARSAEMEALEQDMSDARQRIDQVTGRSRPAAASAPAREPIHGALSPPRHEAVLDGHGKIYYMVWGIVDWAIAAQLWGVSASALLQSLAWSAASRADDFDSDDIGLTRGQARSVSRGMAVVSVGFGLAGAFAAYRASDNIGTYRELKAQELGEPVAAR